MGRITEFFRGVAREMRKTSWPKRSELFKMTITVFVTVFIMVLFFAAVDFAISSVINKLIK